MMQALQSGPRNSLFVAAALLLATVSVPCSADAPTPAFASAERAVLQGKVDEAINTLRPLLTANPANGAAHLLLCRAFYSEEHVDEALPECEAAIKNGLGNNSEAQDWMGRVYGKKADNAGPFTGLKLAHRVKDAFEAAVNLNPANADAVDDLADYYIQAPSIVGGGLDRAKALATRIEGRLPERARRIRAMIAEKQKDNGTAEREFRGLADRSPNRPDAWTDLAAFYLRAKNPDKAVAAIRQSILVNKKRDPSLFQAALLLNQLHREPKLSEDALRSYLTGGATDDGSPTFRAHYELGKLLAAGGNNAGAKAEYAAALALAANYAPARKALQAQ